MSAAASSLEALRAKVRVEDRAAALAQFRADFKAVFAAWRSAGELAADEAWRQYDEAARAVQDHSHDPAWMEGAMRHFRDLVEQQERDCGRAQRIAAEVRAARQQADRRVSR